MQKVKLQEFMRRLGPGLITGAADDDPSGIATYSQAGAQFRFGLVWTLFLTMPLMIGIQMLAARIGYVTGEGLSANIAKTCPRWLTWLLIGLLVFANTINIAANLSAMGEAVALLVGGSMVPYIVGFGLLSLGAQIYFSYESTVRILKYLTLALFAYVAVVLMVSVPWERALREAAMPWDHFPKNLSGKDYAAMVVAVLGTTISPYLFFWQAAQEVELRRAKEARDGEALTPERVKRHLPWIKLDTYAGMILSNGIALCIVIATAVTLNLQGITDIKSSAQAAEALRPAAGDAAFFIFALGIVATGLLAIPVLAGSAAYAVSEVFGWRAGLSRGFHEARGFYAIIIVAVVIGTVMGTLQVDPMKALVWSAVVNGVIAVPIMLVMMLIGQSSALMHNFTITPRHRFLGWSATAVMGVAVGFLVVTSF